MAMMPSRTTPQLRTVPKLWICIDQEDKTITAYPNLMSDEATATVRKFDDDLIDQLTAAVIEERLK